jgi:hypothetical protein
MSMSFAGLNLIPKWISWAGYVASLIYLIVQAELFATVVPGFPFGIWQGLLGARFG